MRNFIILSIFVFLTVFTGCAATPFAELSPSEKLEMVYGNSGVSYQMKGSVVTLAQNTNTLEVINNRFDSNPVITFSCESVGEERVNSKLVGGIVGGGIYHHKVEIPKRFYNKEGVILRIATPISTTENNDGSSTTTESVEIFDLKGALLNRE